MLTLQVVDLGISFPIKFYIIYWVPEEQKTSFFYNGFTSDHNQNNQTHSFCPPWVLLFLIILPPPLVGILGFLWRNFKFKVFKVSALWDWDCPQCLYRLQLTLYHTNSILHHLLGPQGTSTGYLQWFHNQSQSERTDTITLSPMGFTKKYIKNSN